ncbi:hypothetical protein Tco_0589895 [Tanacetum coccineum]
MSSSSSTSYRRYDRNQDVTHKTHCECEPPHPILVQVAWTIENPGRRFKGCPIRDKDKKCRVYGFLNLELPPDYYKQLLYDLHEETKALKRMNKMLGVMEDSSKRLPNYSNNQMSLATVAWDPYLGLQLLPDVIFLSSDGSTDEDINEGPSKGRVPKEGPFFLGRVIKEGPSVEGLLEWYGYDSIKDYLSDTYFSSTDKDTTYKDSTDEDNIEVSYSLKFKGKYVPIGKKASKKPFFKSPIPVKGYVLGLANAKT